MPHVLIVDDDLDMSSLLVRNFQRNSWTAESVVGGNAALERINQGGIDVVVSDLRMPNGTGIELLRKLRRNEKGSPPVIILTGLIEQGHSYLEALGAFRIFTKPASSKDLLKAAEEAYAKSKSAK